MIYELRFTRMLAGLYRFLNFIVCFDLFCFNLFRLL